MSGSGVLGDEVVEWPTPGMEIGRGIQMCKFDGRRRAAQLSLGSAAFSRFSPLVRPSCRRQRAWRRGPSASLRFRVNFMIVWWVVRT